MRAAGAAALVAVLALLFWVVAQPGGNPTTQPNATEAIPAEAMAAPVVVPPDPTIDVTVEEAASGVRQTVPPKYGVRFDLSGRVHDTDGEPVPGAVVSIQEGVFPFSTIVESRSGAEDGAFLLSSIEPRWAASGMLVRAKRDGYREGRAEIAPFDGSPPSDLVVVIEKRAVGSVAGHVVDTDGLTVAGATVSASPEQFVDPTGHFEMGGDPATTDEAGAFVLEGVPTDRALVWRARAEGYLGKTVRGEPEGWPDDILFTVEPAPKLVIHVVDPAGRGVPGAQVKVGEQGKASGYWMKTDAEGVLAGYAPILPPWTLMARATGESGGRIQLEARLDLDAVPDGPVEIVLPFGGVRCMVSLVRADTGEPWVYKDFTQARYGALFEATVDGGGPLTSRFNDPHPLVLGIAEAGGYLPPRWEAHLGRADHVLSGPATTPSFSFPIDVPARVGLYVGGILGATTDIEAGQEEATIALSSGDLAVRSWLRFRAVSHDGHPIQTILIVRMDDDAFSSAMNFTAGQDGSFRLGPLTFGVHHRLMLLQVGVGRAFLDFRIEEVGETDLGDIVIEPGARVPGRVTNGSGKGASDATIRMVYESGSDHMFGSFPFWDTSTTRAVQPGGWFAVDMVAPGDHLLVVEAPDRAVAAHRVRVVPGDEIHQPVALTAGAVVEVRAPDGGSLQSIALLTGERETPIEPEGDGRWRLDPAVRYRAVLHIDGADQIRYFAPTTDSVDL